MSRLFKRACILRVLVPAFMCLACLCELPCADGSELKKETATAFSEYVKVTETRMAEELRPGGAFLYPDTLPSPDRDGVYQRLRRGEIFVTRLETTIQGKEIPVPKGIIHHWVGIAFISSTNMRDVLRVAQDYENRTEVYKPDVIASKLIWHKNDDYKIFLRLIQKKFTTVVLNTEYAIHWGEVDPKHIYSTSYSTKIAEVRDPSNPNGPELPAENNHGYLWRLYTYWRFAEKDGGVYLQCELISLTRDIPYGLGWLIRPLITSIPKQSLDRLLTQTRAAVVHEGVAINRLNAADPTLILDEQLDRKYLESSIPRKTVLALSSQFRYSESPNRPSCLIDSFSLDRKWSSFLPSCFSICPCSAPISRCR